MPIKDNRLVILSYSAFNIYSLCPNWYYREKVLREPTPEEDESYNTPGLIVHHAAEAYLKKGIAEVFNPEVLSAAVKRYAEKPKVDLVKAYGSIDKAIAFTCTCGENLFRFLLSHGLQEKKNFECEIWFGDWDDPLMLSANLATQGGADLVEKNPNNTALLYDYKATWSTKNLNRDQLILYKIALRRKFNINCTMGSFFLLPKNSQTFFHFTEEDEQDLLRRMQAAADNILAGNFPTTPNKKCQRCPFFSSCKDDGRLKCTLPSAAVTQQPFPSFQGFPSVEL